jgi:N utilization substance protein A
MPATSSRRRPTSANPQGESVDVQEVLSQLRVTGQRDEGTLIAALEHAVASTYARLVPDAAPVSVRIDLAAGSVELYRETPEGIEPILSRPPDFARQAAHAAKAAVASWLREAERGRVIGEVVARRGELVDAIVERTDSPVWGLRAGGFDALLPPEEQIPGEELERGQHCKVLVLDVRRRARDAIAVVSRSHPHLLRRLLEQEVPELASGQVTVRAIAREPGRRSKVAVHAPAGDVDPEGACIGPHGVRIKAVVAELGEEQVHIVGWSADPATFVAGSLAPAQVIAVELDSDTRTAHVTVPVDQLSLAIGRAGENARLAARLTGWRIDIAGEGSG